MPDPNLLLVEDNPADIRLLQEVLALSRCEVNMSVARDGIEASRILFGQGRFVTARRPQLILLDINLPRKSGFELLADIKTDPHLRAIPVVIFSSSSCDRDIYRAYDLGANCYLSKPSTLDEFFHVIGILERFWLRMAELPAPEPVQQPCG